MPSEEIQHQNISPHLFYSNLPDSEIISPLINDDEVNIKFDYTLEKSLLLFDWEYFSHELEFE